MEMVPEPSQSSEATVPLGTANQNSNGHTRPLVTKSTGSDATAKMTNGNDTTSTVPVRRPPRVVAVEEEDDVLDDVIPGPRPEHFHQQKQHHKKTSAFSKIFPKSSMLSNSQTSGSVINASNNSRLQRHSNHSANAFGPNNSNSHDDDRSLDLSSTEHRIKGNGILASRADLGIPPVEFAAGCTLLQACAVGELARVQELLQQRPKHINFRDYDRRTALHVAASEGHLDICNYLVNVKHAKINRSDRWGGSPLDDAHRHRHREVVLFLREHGAVTGSGNQSTNLITAAAAGDLDEVNMLLTAGGTTIEAIVSKGDYDKRTPLHLAASEGHASIVLLLCKAKADVNVEDRWGSRPLDDALKAQQDECVDILKTYGAKQSDNMISNNLDQSQTRREQDNLKVDFEELEMVDKIGSGAFGEIYKCRWRGTMVAAKCIKSAKIRQDWVNKRAMESIEAGADVDEAMKQMDEAEMDQADKEEALDDFRQEIAVLKSLRHPHCCLLLAFSTTENYEVMISELMECSLLDVFRAHQVHMTKLARKSAISYAIQLARGMNYLHTCKPPIVHRDLKPANLLLDHTGVLKISDFGLAKVRADPKNKKEKGRFMTGETGSYRFMAPEVFRHEDYNETVDVYSYAMILFYLLDGNPPWPTLNGIEAVRRASDEGDRPIIPRNWDQRLTSLLMECWDENKSARPPFKQILQNLDNYSSDVFHTADITKSSRTIPTESDCTCIIL